MSKRAYVFLFLLLVACSGTAMAATIDPGLQSVLAGKSDGELVRVLMLMERPADLTAVEARLAGATFEERRATVIDALRTHAAEVQAASLQLLADAQRAGRAADVRSLWLVNGIAFRGDRATIEALAASKAPGTLVYDRPYDMISSVTGPRSAAPAGDGDGTAFAQAKDDTAWGVKYINANDVWIQTGYTGNGIVVGHFDTGAWLTHPDLVNRLWVNTGEIPGNGLDDDGNGYVDDVHGYDFADLDSNPNDDVIGGASNHGTHTAGTVCGDGTNGTHTGVAPGAQLMVCKSYLSDGSGAPFSAIYEGQQYALMMGARIFTMSLGVAGDIPVSVMQTEREGGDAIRAAGVVLFNSAGNDHFNYDPPLELGVTARVPSPWHPTPGTPYSSRSGVMAVGGTSYKSTAVYSASSQGPVTWQDVPPWFDWPYGPGFGLVKPDVAAPAVNINSLQKPSGYTGETWSGTSMACPHAAGVAALLLEKNPSLSPAGIDSIMEQTALDLGVAGKDNVFGSGLIDALRAVNAVPAAVRPHVVPVTTMLDASGDGIFDPGETVNLVIELANNSSTVDATGVTAGLAVAANPYVTVTDASGSYPDLLLGGGTGDNSGDVFQLTASPGTPQGYVFTLLLTVYAQNGYQTTFDLDLFVGLPDFLTHDVGSVFGTVTDQGIIGYMSTSQVEGEGFGSVASGVSDLYVGSLWAGTGVTYMCNRDYPGTSPSVDSFDWEVVETPNGRCKDLGAGRSDQDYVAIFSDSGHASPKNIVVRQESYAWADPPYDNFIMLVYWIRNDGTETLTDYHVGVFCDLDIGDYSTNQGATDADRHLTYMYSSSGKYVGVALLYPHTHRNLTLINNQTYVYPNGMIDDGFKGRHLKGIISTPVSTGPDDWSLLTSTGPYTLAPGDSIQCSFALVYGNSLAELQSNTDAAHSIYAMSDTAELTPRPTFHLAQNRPNPFNPLTTIFFTVATEGPVRIDIYDLSGRKVRSLVNQSYAPGPHQETWNGADDAGHRLPSGVYIYRYSSGGQTMSRKMMLVK